MSRWWSWSAVRGVVGELVAGDCRASADIGIDMASAVKNTSGRKRRKVDTMVP
jgi:hypothetical protein